MTINKYNEAIANEQPGRSALLECRNLFKSYGPTKALSNVSLTIEKGEVCGLIGENGSGKSTLSSIISGVTHADSGGMKFKGLSYKPSNMFHAQQAGISMIVQEAATLPSVSVAENVFVGHFKEFANLGLVDHRKMNAQARSCLEKIGVNYIEPTQTAGQLNFEERKIIEIARAMQTDPDLLIIDETTTALAQNGRKIIYSLINKIRNKGGSVIFISHDLEEIMGVCNSIIVLRDGNYIDKLHGDQISIDKMRSLMIGRQLNHDYYRSDYEKSINREVILSAESITSADGYVRECSFQLYKGEILGFGGLANSGMHEIGRMLFGLDQMAYGSIIHHHVIRNKPAPYLSIKNKIGYLSKSRDSESIILFAPIKDNIVLSSLRQIKKMVFIFSRDETEMADQQIKELRIKCRSNKQYCSELSGGNKQKVAFAKWLAAKSDIFILDCPTRGIDIGVKAAMYKLIYQLKKDGKSVILISEEMPELIGMSDRMLIMKNGQITQEICRSRSVNESDIIHHMI